MDGDLRPFTVVGVVGDVRDQNLAIEPTPTFYAYQPQREHACGASLTSSCRQPAIRRPSWRRRARSCGSCARTSRRVLRTMETIVSTLSRRSPLRARARRRVRRRGARARDARRLQRDLVSGHAAPAGDRRAHRPRRAARRRPLARAASGRVAGGHRHRRRRGRRAFLTRLLKGLVFGVSTTDPIAFGGVIVLLAVWRCSRAGCRPAARRASTLMKCCADSLRRREAGRERVTYLSGLVRQTGVSRRKGPNR